MFNTLPRTALRRTHNSIKIKLEDRKYSKLSRQKSNLDHPDVGSIPLENMGMAIGMPPPYEEKDGIHRSRSERISGRGDRLEVDVEASRMSRSRSERKGRGDRLEVDAEVARINRSRSERRYGRYEDFDFSKSISEKKVERKEEENELEVEVDGITFKIEDRSKVVEDRDRTLQKLEGKENNDVQPPTRERSRVREIEIQIGESSKGKGKLTKPRPEYEERERIKTPQPPGNSKHASSKNILGRGVEAVVRFWGYQDLLPCANPSPRRA